MIESIFTFANTSEYMNSDNIINGIRILKYRKDIALKNYYFSKEDSFSRLTKNPYEILPIEDMSNREKKEVSSNYEWHYHSSIYYSDHQIWEKSGEQDIWKNDLNFLCECFNIIAFGDLVKADVLFHNQVLYLDEKRNTVYYDEVENKVKKISYNCLKKKIGFDKDFHTILVLPHHLIYENKENQQKLYEMHRENIEKIKEIFDKNEIGPIVGKLARVKFKSKSKFCECKKDEIVYIQKKGKLRDRFNVINEKGEIKQATSHQLSTLPDCKQEKSLIDDFIQKRKDLLIKEQEEGLPILTFIKRLNDFSLICCLSSGQTLSIPRSIIPLFELKDHEIKENVALWIKIPKWFYKREFEYYYN